MSASGLRAPASEDVAVAGRWDEGQTPRARDPRRTRHEPPLRPRTAAQPQVAPLPGFTATGAAVLATATATLAAMLDIAISPGLGALFGFVFVMMSVLVALRLGWRDAWGAVALPPLVFVAAAAISAQVQPADGDDWVARTSTAVATAVLDHPGYLLIGTVLAALAIGYRARVE